MTTLVHFDKTRIDKAATKDRHRPALCQVFLDLDREVMYATDGFLIAINKVKVTQGDEPITGLVAMDVEAMAWLLGTRGKMLTFLLEEIDGMLTVKCGTRRVAVEREVEIVPGISEQILKAAEKHYPHIIRLDIRRLKQITDATGDPYMMLAFDADEEYQPLLIASKDSAGIVMPMYMEKTQEAIGRVKALLWTFKEKS